jgi:hypothetical protein
MRSPFLEFVAATDEDLGLGGLRDNPRIFDRD